MKLLIEILGQMAGGVFHPAGLVVGCALDAEQVFIGSCPRQLPAVVLHHGSVTRTHAQLDRDQQGWTIRDLGSDNGTWLLPADADFRVSCTFSCSDLRALHEHPCTSPCVVALGAVVIRLTPDGLAGRG
jgi:hypothetical protein